MEHLEIKEYNFYVVSVRLSDFYFWNSKNHDYVNYSITTW